VRRLCVFCGSSAGESRVFAQAASAFGAMLAQRAIGVVYGGGGVGLMGALADGALAAGGEVVGVIPHGLWHREVGHPAIASMHVVDTMHERKALMMELADGFVALPGGIGTLEELFEVWTWGQLGIHRKPCGVLNVAGYYDALMAFVTGAVEHGFVRQSYRDMLLVEDDPEQLLARMASYEPPEVPRWLGRGET
jgi:uncharacterized protein (TIGR00730 family)